MEDIKEYALQLENKLREAKTELERMNLGNAHDVIVSALSINCECKDKRALNMNDIVTCTLTETGASVVNSVYMELNTKNGVVCETNYKCGDTYTSSLWDLFVIFGSRMCAGADCMIKDIKMCE